MGLNTCCRKAWVSSGEAKRMCMAVRQRQVTPAPVLLLPNPQVPGFLPNVAVANYLMYRRSSLAFKRRSVAKINRITFSTSCRFTLSTVVCM